MLALYEYGSGRIGDLRPSRDAVMSSRASSDLSNNSNGLTIMMDNHDYHSVMPPSRSSDVAQSQADIRHET